MTLRNTSLALAAIIAALATLSFVDGASAQNLPLGDGVDQNDTPFRSPIANPNQILPQGIVPRLRQ
jgi:hypothetical protein